MIETDTPNDSSESTDDEEYPGLRHALKSDAAVNLYCGTKWFLWHGFNLLYVLLASVVVAIATGVFVVWTILDWAWHFTYRGVTYAADRVPVGQTTRKVTHTVREKTERANEKSRGTPVIRRIYGYCPVNIRGSPRWYSWLEEKFDATGGRISEAAKPPDKYHVCPNCGNIEQRPVGGCFTCRTHSPDWVAVYGLGEAEKLSDEYHDEEAATRSWSDTE